MIEMILAALALANAILTACHVSTWVTAYIYWAILTALWAGRAMRKGRDRRLGD